MKLRNIDLRTLSYPVKLSFSDDEVESELVLFGILVPSKYVYAGVPIIYCSPNGMMVLPEFLEKYGDMDVNLFLEDS
jgi:hypothetical protein